MDRATISEPVNAEQPGVEKFKQFKEYYLTHPIAFIENFTGYKLSLWQKIYLLVLYKTRRHK